MAKEQEAAETTEAPPKKGKKKLIIILAAVLILLIAGVAAAFLLLSSPADENANHQAAEEDHGPPIYASLEPITIKLADGETYLQVEIKLRMATPESQEKLKEYLPEIRSDILGVLAGKQPDEISTQEGMAKLADELKVLINGVLKAKEGEGVKKVLFGSFITQ